MTTLVIAAAVLLACLGLMVQLRAGWLSGRGVYKVRQPWRRRGVVWQWRNR